MIKAIILFYIFKFEPKDSCFWRKSVSVLNKARSNTGDAFYLWKFWKLAIRDPYAIPMASHWTFSERHPFCYNLTGEIK